MKVNGKILKKKCKSRENIKENCKYVGNVKKNYKMTGNKINIKINKRWFFIDWSGPSSMPEVTLYRAGAQLTALQHLFMDIFCSSCRFLSNFHVSFSSSHSGEST